MGLHISYPQIQGYGTEIHWYCIRVFRRHYIAFFYRAKICAATEKLITMRQKPTKDGPASISYISTEKE
jgi:hypothetical protein